MIPDHVLILLERLPEEKREVTIKVITKLVEKVFKGCVEHGEDATQIKNREELTLELLDALFYNENEMYQTRNDRLDPGFRHDLELADRDE